MTGFKALLATALTAFVLNSCTTSVSSLDARYAEKAKQHIVKDSSSLGKLFLENDIVMMTDKKWAQKEIEQLVEENYSLYMNKKIDFPSTHFKETGYQLVVTKRGSLDIDGIKLYYNQDLAKEEMQAISYLAERTGTKGLKKNDKSERFKELTEIFKADKKERKQLLNNFDNKYSLPEPEYAAYMMDIGGYAIGYLLYYYIRMDKEAHSLYKVFATQAHEYSHTMIYNEMGPGYGATFLFASLNWNDNKEIMPIHETACDVLADRVSDLFIENSLEQGSELYNETISLREYFSKSDEVKQDILEKYESYPEEERISKRGKVLESLSELFYEETGKKRNFNEARLAIMARYSGIRDIRTKLEELLDDVGPNMFIQLVPYMYHKKDIGTIQERVDNGMTSLHEIVAPIAVEQCPVKPYEITF